VLTPYRLLDDEYFALACDVSLVFVLVFTMLLKVNDLTESKIGENSVIDFVTKTMEEQFKIDMFWLTVGLFIGVVSVLTFLSVVAAQQITKAARVPIIRLRASRETPLFKLAPTEKWHLFLSHVWGTGQDQCATIKRQTSIMLPHASIFLDTDDLKDIGALEEYIDQSRLIMVFVSKGYFLSRNCLRELNHAVASHKAIALMYDPVRGGATLDDIYSKEVPTHLQHIFKGRDMITWHRIKEFQQISLKLLATQIVAACELGRSRKQLKAHKSGKWQRDKNLLYIPGEISSRKLTLIHRTVIYTSVNNPGHTRFRAGGLAPPLTGVPLPLCAANLRPCSAHARAHQKTLSLAAKIA